MANNRPKLSVSGEEEEDRAASPLSSCQSVKSDQSKEPPLAFSNEPGPLDVKPESVGGGDRAASPLSSCQSVKSDQSKEPPLAFSNEPGPLGVKERKRTSDAMKDLEECDSVDSKCPNFGKRSRNNPELQMPCQRGTIPITESLQEVLGSYKMNLRRRFEFAAEATAEAGPQTRLNRIYTELYITEGQCESVNVQHEVWQLETLFKLEALHDTPIKYHDIFKILTGQKSFIKVVLTNGIAGIGKTFSVRKFTLDWAEGLENQDVGLVILFSFRELNLLKERQYSLLRLFHDFHPSLHMVTAETLAHCQVLLIFDGLDESRLVLDFQNSEVISDVTQTSSVDVLFTNLIKGNLLPSALLWITSRPAAAKQIPPSYVDRVTEVRGFTDVMKNEYFRRRFNDGPVSEKILSHIKASRSLYIMCHIPVFCWITANVLEHTLTTDLNELPKTLTQMYSLFLLFQSQRKTQKYDNGLGMIQQERMQSDKEVLLKLGRLAFEHLDKVNAMFYQEDLDRCGLDAGEALVFSGLCTEIFKRECALFQRMIYTFVHLSIQEFLSAVYMVDCYMNKDIEVLATFLGEDWDGSGGQPTLDDLLRKVVDKSLKSENGHLDLFVRFLHGLLLESNHCRLGGLLGWTPSSPGSIQKVINNLKKVNAYDISPDRSINIFHCLIEMNDNSVHREIQEYLQSDNKSEKTLNKTHCSALAYMLQMSEEVLDVLDLKKYNSSGDGRRRLLPAVRNCREARLSECGLSEWHCEVLSSALMSNPSHLRTLDLSDNDYLLDSGVKLLSVGLESPTCRLEILRLKSCCLSESCCVSLASALKATSSHLRELDLSNNNYLRDPGVKLLCTGLQSPHCRLEKLSLSCCGLSGTGCAHLASAMKSNPSHMKELDLSKNKLKDLGVNHLSVALESPQCRLTYLRVDKCGLTESCCSSLASALKSNPSSLRELDLSGNDLQDPGVKLLCKGLESSHCRLEALRLRRCWLSESCCASVASALMSNPSSLRELDLSENDLQDSGVKLLTSGLESPHCRLETLRLSGCRVSDEGGAFLAAALKSNPSHLQELDLSKNKMQQSGVQLLSRVQESPHCRLPLRMEDMV